MKQAKQLYQVVRKMKTAHYGGAGLMTFMVDSQLQAAAHLKDNEDENCEYCHVYTYPQMEEMTKATIELR